MAVCCHAFPPAIGATADGPEDGLLSQLFSLVLGCGERPGDHVPSYWATASPETAKDWGYCKVDEDCFYPVPQEDRQILETLMNRTSKNPEYHFRLVRAVRVENPDLWRAYQDKVSHVKRRRGACEFAGSGEPTTITELDCACLSDGFPGALEADACEAYLWHATKPDTAARIVRQGFRVGHRSTFGKRFGQGSYFSEDAAKADSYAAGGEGLYKDCYAMLLCRVVLGRQLVTKAFRSEDSASEAYWRHDSVLAEPRGASYREFVALEDAQAYPEFALVYERRPLPDSQRGRIQRTLSINVPQYWNNASSGSEFFHVAAPDQEVEACVQGLVNESWEDAFTSDRLDSLGSALEAGDPHSDMPRGLSVLKVLRFEDSSMWDVYRKTRHAVRAKLRGSGVPAAKAKCRTARGEMPLVARANLDSESNEVYLWHGCAPEVAMSVFEKGGFPEAIPRTSILGQGYYLADSAARADELSGDNKEGYYRGHYALLLCRAVLGRIGPNVATPSRRSPNGGRPLAVAGMCGGAREFDSILGRRDASAGAFSEFVVPDGHQLYPEYAIIYERVYSEPRVR